MENSSATSSEGVSAPLPHEQQLLYAMLLIRRFEERAAEEYSRMNIRGFLHLYIGEEAVACGVMAALRPEDLVLSTYREHGHALARGLDPRTVMAEMFGRQEGCCRGRGGSMHLFDVSRNSFGGNAIVAGHLPLAVGMALALRKQKKEAVVCCFFGEGAMAEGEFHEAMNLASLLRAPVLFICENNRYAMGTSLAYTHAMTELEKKGGAYNIAASAVDGMDVRAVEEEARKAVAAIRQGGGPWLLVCHTYRFRAHSMFDAELYRGKKEVEEWKQRDPVMVYTNYLLASGRMKEEEVAAMKEKVERETAEAVAFAEAGSWEPIDDLTRWVYSENP